MFFTWVWEYPLAGCSVLGLRLGLSTQRSVPRDCSAGTASSLILAMEVALVLALLLVGVEPPAASGRSRAAPWALPASACGCWSDWSALRRPAASSRRRGGPQRSWARPCSGLRRCIRTGNVLRQLPGDRVAEGQHVFSHGTTVHGSQYMDSRSTGEPTSYYSRRRTGR